jgi:ubiquinone/menaquinone biosynthesis C-methylase UbiE
MNKKNIYEEKNGNYYSLIRHDLIQMIEGNNNKILEVGCGDGQTGWALKKSGKTKEVVGIELVEGPAKRAEKRLDKVIQGDVEEITLPFHPEYFDYIIMGDVIEHLIDPWSTLKKMSQFLSREGCLIASIPNIGHWRVLKDLILFDQWEYQKEGILDKGHLRFFTKKSMVEMMREAGFEVESINARRSLGTKARLFNLVTLGIFRKFFESAYIIKGRKIRAC